MSPLRVELFPGQAGVQRVVGQFHTFFKSVGKVRGIKCSAETGSQGSLSERGDALRQAVQKAMTAYPPS